MFLAESTDTAWQVVVAGLVGGFLTKTVDYVIQFLRDQRKDRQLNAEATRQARREDESETLSRMEAMLDRSDRQLEAAQRENIRWQEIANRATVRAERAVVWIKHLEAMLRSKNIEFEAWVEDGDSKTVYRPPSRPTQAQGDQETEVGPDGGFGL